MVSLELAMSVFHTISVAKIYWHRHGIELRHCHSMYSMSMVSKVWFLLTSPRRDSESVNFSQLEPARCSDVARNSGAPGQMSKSSPSSAFPILSPPSAPSFPLTFSPFFHPSLPLHVTPFPPFLPIPNPFFPFLVTASGSGGAL